MTGGAGDGARYEPVVAIPESLGKIDLVEDSLLPPFALMSRYFPRMIGNCG